MFKINESLQALILDNSGVGIVYVDTSCRIHLWNNYMSIRTGLAVEDVMGIHIKDALIHVPKTFFQALTYVKDHCLPRVLSPVFHMSYMSKDIPQKQFIKILPVLDDMHEVQGILIIIEDVTTHLEYEEQIEKKSKNLKILEEKARKDEEDALNWLKEQLDFNKALTENLGEGIIVFNRGGNITTTNPATEKTLRWSNIELFGVHIKNIMSDSSKVLGILEHGNVVRSEEEFFIRKDGTLIPVSYVASPIVLDDKIKAVIITFLDISEKKAIEDKLKEEYKRTKRVLDDLVKTLSYTTEIRDPYTAGHQRRVTEIALAIAEEMGIDEDKKEAIEISGALHDIGKIAIPSEILSKPGRLNDYEFQLLKGHSRIGYDILKEIEFNYPIAKIVLQHHERLDGSGYPDGIKGDEILFEAKVLAVADVVEAIASHRPYRPALGIEAALDEIEKKADMLYDKNAVRACIRLFKEEDFKLE